MDDHDPADLDGDGEFDAIDMMTLEGDEGAQDQKQASGCVVGFVLLTASTTFSLWAISRAIAG